MSRNGVPRTRRRAHCKARTEPMIASTPCAAWSAENTQRWFYGENAETRAQATRPAREPTGTCRLRVAASSVARSRRLAVLGRQDAHRRRREPRPSSEHASGSYRVSAARRASVAESHLQRRRDDAPRHGLRQRHGHLAAGEVLTSPNARSPPHNCDRNQRLHAGQIGGWRHLLGRRKGGRLG
jgi:hypothetical protein